MKEIIFNHTFIYFNKKGEVIKEVPATAKELTASAESCLKHFGAYEVKKFNNETGKYV